jgi:hypothetical protein
MPLRDPKSESHVVAAAAAQESTMQILNAVRPRTVPGQNPHKAPDSSFIENVEMWVNKYLNLADEVLQSPPAPELDIEEPAA